MQLHKTAPRPPAAALTSLFVIMLAYAFAARAQEQFKVTLLEGTAKVQRAQKRDWSKLSLGDQINDNDIVETFFQSRLIVEYGGGNMAILGPNTKALLNLSAGDNGLEFGSTLFSGGLFVKAIRDSRASLYTSNGVAQTDSGSISTVFEAKTGYTGFQVLGGSASVRNVAQQKSRRLATGQTTIIQQGKEPTAALYITRKHVGVLKHFFGAEYIEHEMQLSNIKPTEEKKAANRLSMSSGYADGAATRPDMGMYKKQFNKNRIYGSIVDDRLANGPRYISIARPAWIREQKAEARFATSFGIANGQSYPRFELGAAFSFKLFQAALRIPLAKDASQSISPHFNGFAGILDKIAYLGLGSRPDSTYLYLGDIDNLRLGNGLVTDGFSNNNPYSAIRPAGLSAHFKKGAINARGFLADLSRPFIGGVHVALQPANYSFGAGYYFDFSQFSPVVHPGASRFVPHPDISTLTLSPALDSVQPSAHIYELTMAVGLLNTIEQHINLEASFAQKVGRQPGFALLAPHISYSWNIFRAGGGFLVEQGAMISPYFHSFYLSNRNRLFSADTITYIRTQSSYLAEDRYANGFIASFGASFFKGTALDLRIRHDFASRDVFTLDAIDSVGLDTDDPDAPLDSVASRNNFSLEASLSMDERLLPAIAYGSVYVRQAHGAYYPENGTYFGSWGLAIGGELITAPLFAKLAFDAGVQYSFLDLDFASEDEKFNNLIDPGDAVFEFRLGLRWGFL
jgi:hypothetical protein